MFILFILSIVAYFKLDSYMSTLEHKAVVKARIKRHIVRSQAWKH